MACCIIAGLLVPQAAMAQMSQPRTVSFPSADGKTTLVGYLFAPAGRPNTAPAVVLMHGRSGAYSSLAKGNYSAVTLEPKLRSWAQLWSEQGYWALVVDSFGPRGYPAGFPDTTKPPPVSELATRPFDAYGALRYLRTSPRVKSDRIALQGWSNGGSAALASMSPAVLAIDEAVRGHGFRAAVAIDPGCAPEEHLKSGYAPYAPVHIFVGTRDEEVSAAACVRLAAATKAAGGDIALSVFDGATRDYDDPARAHQQVAANATAAADTRKQALAAFAAVLR